jgi:hypothetical protein
MVSLHNPKSLSHHKSAQASFSSFGFFKGFTVKEASAEKSA